MLIKVGKLYLKAEDIRAISEKEVGTEEDKQFGIDIFTDRQNYTYMCEGQTARKGKIDEIIGQMNKPDAQLTEIRQQLTNINTRINRIERKQTEIQKSLKRIEEALQH